jgi:uncharacterized membrane protein
MDPHLWDKIHGAVTHFPIALSLASVALEVAGCVFRGSSAREQLQVSAKFTLWIGALASVPAVASGLVMTRGRVLGHDLIRMHHLFAGRHATPRSLLWYRLSVVVAAGLTAAAGAFGGEMLLAQ